jgi:2-polyprenyl-3-methyl-5-hydroxy-6-metoxy-1,4-benzoquinol methylase
MYNKEEHYEIEKDLAEKLKCAPRDQRLLLYTKVYDTMFEKVSCHPQLMQNDAASVLRENMSKKAFVSMFFDKDKNFIEFGAGDGSFSNFVSDEFKNVYAVDCSDVLNKIYELKNNVKRIVQDCSDVLCLDEPVDVAFSANLLEHLHPEDCTLHLKNVYEKLEAGGVYLVLVPNKCGGPNDVSRDYDDFATCFHLNECTSSEIMKLFFEAGFREVRLYLCVSYRTVRVSAPVVNIVERLLLMLPHNLRKRLMKTVLFRPLNQLRLIALK